MNDLIIFDFQQEEDLSNNPPDYWETADSISDNFVNLIQSDLLIIF